MQCLSSFCSICCVSSAFDRRVMQTFTLCVPAHSQGGAAGRAQHAASDEGHATDAALMRLYVHSYLAVCLPETMDPPGVDVVQLRERVHLSWPAGHGRICSGRRESAGGKCMQHISRDSFCHCDQASGYQGRSSAARCAGRHRVHSLVCAAVWEFGVLVCLYSAR